MARLMSKPCAKAPLITQQASRFLFLRQGISEEPDSACWDH